jgi:hypothetical protein
VYSRKVLDSNNLSSLFSKADKTNRKIDYYLKKLRSPNLPINKFLDFRKENVLNKIINRYKLNNVDFGNWTSQTQRYNFILALFVALYDLEKVLKFKNDNIGQKVLSIGYGSRGVKGAYAHYDSFGKYINLSRERRADKVGTKDKELLRELYSGFGSLAHEYGHFLDYYFGNKSAGLTTALTGGRCTLMPIDLKKSLIKFDPTNILEQFENITQGTNNVCRDLMYNIFVGLFLNSKSFRPTDFYRRIYTYSKNVDSKYWIQYNEIWARIFEVYIVYKLKKINIVNKVLVAEGRGKYAKDTDLKRRRNPVYPTFTELKQVVPYIDDLMIEFNKLI